MNWNELPSAEPPRAKVDLNEKTRLAFEAVGWTVGLTQSFNHKTQHSSDLWGFGDLIMHVPGGADTVIVQACARGDRSTRLKKLVKCSQAWDWICSPRKHVWIVAWKKCRGPSVDSKGRIREIEQWLYDIRIVTKDDFDPCLINQWEDAGPRSVSRGRFATVTVKNITEDCKERSELYTRRLELVNPSTTQRNG